MAAKKEETGMEEKNFEQELEDGFTFVETAKEPEYKGPMVDVFIPRLEEAGGGMKTDQYEHVTIANEHKEKCYKVLRGERVEVPVPVFLALKERYPNI